MYIAAKYEPKPEKLMEDGKRKKESKPRKQEEEDGGGPPLADVRQCWRWPEVVAQLSGLVAVVEGRRVK